MALSTTVGVIDGRDERSSPRGSIERSGGSDRLPPCPWPPMRPRRNGRSTRRSLIPWLWPSIPVSCLV